MHLMTDSAAVHRWVEDALTGRARLRTKAQGEMLIRRRIDLIRQLKEEMKMSISVQLVPSAQNRADKMTRVPSDCIRSGDVSPGQPATAVVCKQQGVALRDNCTVNLATETVSDDGCIAAVATANNSREEMISAITSKHREAGHPGVRRTLYFARRDIAHSVTRGMVQSVLARCEVCQSVDPAPVKWRHGSLEVSETWRRLAIDITHFKAQVYLTVVDCGPSRFSLWRALRRMDAASVLERLEQIFYERGAPAELLADNDTAFRSRNFAAFASRWGVSLRFRAVYRPSGNSIVERNHRTVKVIAARKQCSVDEAVHLYNISPREAGSQNGAPVQGIYRYQVRDCVQHSSSVSPETSHGSEPGQSDEEAGTRMTYGVGDMV